ncbi:MAG TPA: sensor histidine kinase [Coleofasciculaceae cyanobacterium]
MKRPLLTQNHPFPFLLYLEWGLLGIALLGEFLPTPFPRLRNRFPLINLLSLLGFGLMGLRLPRPQFTHKVAYTALEIGFIVVAAAAGKNPRIFPFLYVVLAIRSCLIFKTPGRLTVIGITYGLFLIMLARFVHRPDMSAVLPWQANSRPLVFNFALLLGLVLVLVLLLINALITERQSREKLAIANDQLRQYALRVENLAMAQERNRIAREIHDSLGHALTGLNLQMEGALKLWQSNPEQAHQFLLEAKQLGSTALQEVRRSVSAMRLDPLQGKSLSQAIASLVEDFQRTTSLQPNCQMQLTQPLPPEISTAAYRIVQEALNNIRKYANATAVEITIEAIALELHLQIQDNGSGFQLSENQTGFGLQGIRERAIALGGQIQIDSQPGQGCCIRVNLPLRRTIP